MTKMAVISDVHGNVTALQAVLADARAAGCDTYWFLGDLFMPGPGAHDLLTLLDGLPLRAYVRGNWEDILLATLSGQVDATDPMDIYATLLGDYLKQHLTAADVQRIRDLPQQQDLTVDGWRFQLTHNTRDKNYGHTLMPEGQQADFDDLPAAEADVALYGHTHHQLLRQSAAGQLIMNPGTIGMPFAHWNRFGNDRRAQYAILDTAPAVPPVVTFRRVSYDTVAEAALARERELPFSDFYAEQLATGVVHTHDRDRLTQEIDRLGYRPRFATIMDRFKKE